MTSRRADVERTTKETRIRVELNLDDPTRPEISTGLGFFDHMLTLAGAHGRFGLKVEAEGDLEVDGHHTVEDIGLTLGQALAEALGDKAGINRYGTAWVPMDEALAQAVVDLSGRPWLAYRVDLLQERIGDFETNLVREFFQALANAARLTLHLEGRYGNSDHHTVEALFKAFGRALGQAVRLDPTRSGVPSTKGVL